MRLLLLFVLTAISLLAQPETLPVSIGVKGGVPITDAFNTFRGNEQSYFTNTKRYLIGGTIEFHLPARFGLEVDGLYKRLGFQYEQSSADGSVAANTVANSWEFPVLIKWDVTPGPVRPFVDGGLSFRHLSGVKQIRQTILLPATLVTSETSQPVEFNKETDIGFTFGGGLTFKLGVLRITPELRYTRWGGENFRDPVRALLRTKRNQGDFLLGITF